MTRDFDGAYSAVNKVEWSDIGRAYGPAADVPNLFLALTSADVKIHLGCAVCHAGRTVLLN